MEIEVWKTCKNQVIVKTRRSALVKHENWFCKITKTKKLHMNILQSSFIFFVSLHTSVKQSWNNLAQHNKQCRMKVLLCRFC